MSCKEFADPHRCGLNASVAEPHFFDPDPDPAFDFDANPDPSFHSDAEPDPDPAFISTRIQILPYNSLFLQI